jgi:predicted outer membrane repeat protein
MDAECPKPNGVFQNEAKEKGGVILATYFTVPGFQMPATHVYGGSAKDEPLPASSSPIDILGGIKNGVRQDYHRDPLEKFALELRPIEGNRFRIGVKSSTGLSGEAEGYLKLSGERQRCENGVLKAFWRNYDKIVPGWELYVEATTGDIIMAYNTAIERGEISYRFKRIAP